MRNHTAAERDHIVRNMARRFVDLERTGDTPMRRQVATNGFETACDGRSVKGGIAAWKRAVASARKGKA